MKRNITTHLICLLLLPLTVAAQGFQADVDRLTKEMYRLYSTHEIEPFMTVTDQLKEACLKTKDEGLFYRTWANQASFAFTKVSREKGMEIAKAMNDYSQQHDSKLGFYYSSLANANQASALRMEIKAEEYYLKACKYKQAYLPQINAAPAYLGLAKIYHNRRNQKKILEMTDKTLKEPNLTGPSIVDAWSYRCIAAMYYEGNVQKTELNKAYTEWKRLSEKYNYRSTFTNDIEIYHARVNGDYETMLELAKKAKHPLERAQLISYAYEWQGKWEDALKYYKEYKKISDSINTSDIRKQAAEHALQMDIIRTENEANALKLHNQALRLEHQASELEQERLEKEALDLTLKNRNIELQHAAVLLKNDSLDRHAQQLRLSEYQSKLEAQQSKEHARQLRIYTGAVLATLIMGFMTFYAYYRQRQLKKLRAVNNELQTAYNQLEETTTAKERIESELRIARDIQMSMVPHEFPEYEGLDLYASMIPARAVGGDLYDFLIEDDNLYFCVGDVSGKGVPASLFMAKASHLFHTLAKQHQKPAAIATRMNDELTEKNDNSMFVTMFIGEMNLSTGHLYFCNAGHNPPVIGGDEQKGSFLEMEANAPIGLWPGLDYVGEEIASIKGRPLLIYTDGLNEAENDHQEQLGDERMLDILRHTDFENARQVVEVLEAEVEHHRHGAEASDDLTIMCIRTKVNT
ncbi:PP2C family protein-serine/threonine phosphatase [Prevotella sp. P6B4]|uniref:PP2C family protein-serine/threonine phosphatase n=1 Tax=Prevotella sp. P6B4 TaxID=1410614 RepID=UPI001E530770|nr:PP2C family protein-serine/threonine phosphatase [Prevotella sp. P6B4]